MENSLAERLKSLRLRIREAERRGGRAPESVRLLAVSKQQDVALMQEAAQLGVCDFGENHLQPALQKMQALSQWNLRWHFIGPIQSRKTKEVAHRFDWVHSVDRLEIARRLHEARAPERPKLSVFVQVRIGGEVSKSGIELEAVESFLQEFKAFDRLRVCGLMTIPAPVDTYEAQRAQFAKLRACQERLNDSGFGLSELSMGMSGDFEAAIAEGATWIRIGTDLFGPRPVKEEAHV